MPRRCFYFPLFKKPLDTGDESIDGILHLMDHLSTYCKGIHHCDRRNYYCRGKIDIELQHFRQAAIIGEEAWIA